MSVAFSERRIDAGGVPLSCLEAGYGKAVLVLHGEPGSAPNALEELLAGTFRVVVLESGAFAVGAPQEAARLLTRSVAALALDDYALIAYRGATAAALCHAAEPEAALTRLVLVSPAGGRAIPEERLSAIAAATLVLTGTADPPATEAAGRLCAEHIPECYPMLVYDTGPGMATERPAALLEAVADFVERGGGFVVERQESVISP